MTEDQAQRQDKYLALIAQLQALLDTSDDEQERYRLSRAISKARMALHKEGLDAQ